MSNEGKSALLDIIVFIAGIILLAVGGSALIYADPGATWPLIPSLLSILCFGWVATGISDSLFK